MPLSQAHLSPIADATVLAWHSVDNVQAVRRDGHEMLFVRGACIPLTADMHHPVQQVINYCHAGKRQRMLMQRLWLSLVGTP